MDQQARWIRLAPDAVQGVDAFCRGFARSPGGPGSPVCFWARAETPVRLGVGLWADPGDFVYALLVPNRFAPGRRDRWLSWGLSPVVAALRRFGSHAYLDGGSICLHGRPIGGGNAAEVEGCAAIVGTFPGEPPRSGEEAGRGALLDFDPWLAAVNREGRARQVLAAFRNSLEVQHGWQFDTAWPTEAELCAITAEAVQ